MRQIEGGRAKTRREATTNVEGGTRVAMARKTPGVVGGGGPV